MKRFILIPIISFLIPFNLLAQEYNNFSVSFDPLTFVGLLLSSNDENEESQPIEIDFRYMWFGADISWETEKQREMVILK